jgi:hypothetical protein
MPSTDTKPELTAKASMVQPVSQPAVYAKGLRKLEKNLKIGRRRHKCSGELKILKQRKLSFSSRTVDCLRDIIGLVCVSSTYTLTYLYGQPCPWECYYFQTLPISNCLNPMFYEVMIFTPVADATVPSYCKNSSHFTNK